MQQSIEMTIGVRKKFVKRNREVNLTRLAASSGYSLSHMSRVFNGKTNPSLKCAEVLAECLGIGKDDLIDGIRRRGFLIHNDHNPGGK